ncbi:hypothetical protein Hdeb2414_s0016g00494281 [Helianthus debilis subsp. tardiflorus]
MDVRDMGFFLDNSFDCVIDKGTLDALMCGTKGPTSASQMRGGSEQDSKTWRGLYAGRMINHSFRLSLMEVFQTHELQLWGGAVLICRVLELVILPSASSQAVKQWLLNFVRSLSIVLAFTYCLSSLIQQTQKFFADKKDPSDARTEYSLMVELAFALEKHGISVIRFHFYEIVMHKEDIQMRIWDLQVLLVVVELH